MPRDGNCLFHSRILGRKGAERRQAHFGDRRSGLVATSVSLGCRAGVRRLHADHKDRGSLGGDIGEQWYVRFDARLEHYNVVASAMHEAPKPVGPEVFENACAQAGAGQTDTSKGYPLAKLIVRKDRATARVERWGDSGCRKTHSWGRLHSMPSSRSTLGAAGMRLWKRAQI